MVLSICKTWPAAAPQMRQSDNAPKRVKCDLTHFFLLKINSNSKFRQILTLLLRVRLRELHQKTVAKLRDFADFFTTYVIPRRYWGLTRLILSPMTGTTRGFWKLLLGLPFLWRVGVHCQRMHLCGQLCRQHLIDLPMTL